MEKVLENITYQPPKVAVVAFKVEEGFEVSNLKAEPMSTSTTYGTEDVIQGNGLGDYFTHGN